MGENIAKVVDEWKKMIGSSTCATIGGAPRISNSGIYDPNIIVGLDIWAQRGLSGLGMIDTNKKSEDVIKTLDELADRIGYKEDSIYYSRFKKEIAEKYDEKELRDCLNILIYGNERTGDNKTIYDIDPIILARAICYLDDRIPYISGISKKDKEWREWLTDRAQEVSTQ